MDGTSLGVPLADVQWDEIVRAWRRRDSGPIRKVMEGLLGGDPLRDWQDLSLAVFESKTELLDRAVGALGVDAATLDDADERTWELYADTAVRSLEAAVGALPVHCQPAAFALLATFLYFECLCFWEHSDEYLRFRGLISALEGLHARVGAAGSATGTSWQLMTGACDLTSSLRAQFEVEVGLGCSCPVLFGTATQDATSLLNQAVEDLQGLDIPLAPRSDAAEDLEMSDESDGVAIADCDRLPGGAGATVRALHALLLDEAEHVGGYFDLLREHVGPAALGFVQNLVQRDHDGSVIDRLDQAILEAKRYETSREGRWGVFCTEARAHRATLVAMRDRLLAGAPSLRVTEGEIELLYPFSLPVTDRGENLVRKLVTAERPAPADFVLAGVTPHLLDAPRTSLWIRGNDELLDNGMRLVFDQHQLMLETTAGVLYHDLGIEVRINGLGNHLVRITATTATLATPASQDTSTTGGRNGSTSATTIPWTPHDVDQWVRRIGYDFGEERIWFKTRERATSSEVDTKAKPREYGYFVELVAAIVEDLARLALDTSADARTGRAADKMSDTADDDRAIEHIVRSTKVHSQVMVAVTGLESVMSGGELRPVTDPALIPGLIGASTLLTGQRPFPTGLEEWTRAKVPPLDNLLGDDSLEGELVARNENLTLVFAAYAPHWQMIFYRELVGFTASLAGSYRTWGRWLTTTVRSANQGQAKDPEDKELDRLLEHSIELVDRQRQVRAFLDYVRSRELLYNHRHRRLLDRLMDSGRLNDLEGDVDAALRTVRSHQDWVAALLERKVERREADRRRRESTFNGVIGLVAFLGLFELFAWLNGERNWTGRERIFWAELGGAILVGLVAASMFVYSHREVTARRGVDDPRPLLVRVSHRLRRRGRRAAQGPRDRRWSALQSPDAPSTGPTGHGRRRQRGPRLPRRRSSARRTQRPTRSTPRAGPRPPHRDGR